MDACLATLETLQQQLDLLHRFQGQSCHFMLPWKTTREEPEMQYSIKQQCWIAFLALSNDAVSIHKHAFKSKHAAAYMQSLVLMLDNATCMGQVQGPMHEARTGFSQPSATYQLLSAINRSQQSIHTFVMFGLPASWTMDHIHNAKTNADWNLSVRQPSTCPMAPDPDMMCPSMP